MTKKELRYLIQRIKENKYLTRNETNYIIKALEQEPCERVDLIDRAQAQTEIEMNACRYTLAKERGGTGEVEWSDTLIKVSDAIDIIRNLPSVTPANTETVTEFADRCRECGRQKKGKWINGCTETGALGIRYTEKICSNCGWSHSLIIPKNFCPKCGADMRGEENG